MTLRKGKLQRPCIKCGKSFEPSSKGSRMCRKCKPNSYLDIFYERQERLNKLKQNGTKN